MIEITTEDLRRLKDAEGIILQGCGGDLEEWAEGINEILTEAGILLDGTRFDADRVRVFHNDGLTNLLFLFTDDVHLHMGRLAVWRLQTHSEFGGKWLSDYVPNRLGGFIDEPAEEKSSEQSKTGTKKPDCPLIGADGNVFNLAGLAGRTLRRNGLPDEAREMSKRVFASHSYSEALSIIGEYVNITAAAEDCNEEETEDFILE